MMKVKRSKHIVHHSDGYTPVVRCTLNRRHKVSGSRREESWCTGVSVAFPQKVDIEQMAHDISVREFARISHYAPSTAYKKLGEYVAYGEMERVPRISAASAPHRVTSDGKNSENDVKKLYPKVIVHKQ